MLVEVVFLSDVQGFVCVATGQTLVCCFHCNVHKLSVIGTALGDNCGATVVHVGLPREE